MEKLKKIVILFGGFSEEKEISLISGKEIEKSLKELGYITKMIDHSISKNYSELIENIIDFEPFIVFNALHGAEGEDGRIQALLDLHKIPYTGSGFRASAILMDKFLSSEIVKSMDIPVPDKLLIKDDLLIEKIICSCSFPLVIKPNDSGSSMGISIVNNESEVENAVQEARKFSKDILLEEYIFGRELTVTILNQKALPVVEIITNSGWYDYINKYTKGKTIYQTPAKLSDKETKQIQQYALEIFNNFGCKSYGRIDFRYDSEKFYFLEVNTLPGMTPLSLTPMAAKEAEIDFKELLEIIIQSSLEN
ncbi:MAG: D-alanine--D-alanine ligase [Candidatus Cloacimonetes bacterium]|nr:D-alanine--D-alanine ligase [Candidatus Cloacimonadota bacterium]